MAKNPRTKRNHRFPHHHPFSVHPLEPRILFSSTPQLGFYVQTNLSVTANVTSTEALIARAAAVGYSYMMLDDSKLGYDGILRPNAQNPDFDPTWAYYNNIANVIDYAAARGITVIPSSDEVGRADWVASNINENLIEGQPVYAATFTVSPDGKSLIFDPTNPTLLNPSFESGSTGWALDTGRATITTTTGHTDTDSLQIATGGGRGFGIQTLTLQPHQEYEVSFWVKESSNFSGDELAKIYDPSQGIYLEDHEDDSALAYNTSTGGWQQFTYMFNSGSSTSAQLRLGSWGDTTGTLWYDDVSVTQTALVNVVQNAESPLTVYRPNGTVLTAGIDYNPIVPVTSNGTPYQAGVTGITYATWSNPLTVTIPAGSALKPGDIVKIDYSGVQDIYDGQYAVSLSDPAVQTYYHNNFVQIRKMFATGTPLMLGGYDEIRGGNTEPGELAMGLTGAQLLDQSFLNTYNTIRAVDPTTPIYTWSDMFDPYHNAVNNYYLWNGSLVPTTPGLPSDVTVMNWNLGDLHQSLEYFAANGNPQIISGYYDSGNGTTAAASEVQAAIGVAGVKGLMYTTWVNDYSQLENYAASAKAAWAQYITPPTVTAVHVSSTQWSQAYLNSLASSGQGSATLGYTVPTGPNQLKTLPWDNLNQISITFSENVTITSASLSLTGLKISSYAISNFSYNSSTDTATWTLTTALTADTVQLTLPATGAHAVTDIAGNPLDGEWTDNSSTSSGNGTPGGNFSYHLNVLPGDLDSSRTVDINDLAILAANWQKPATSVTQGDLDASGTVDINDLAVLAANWQTSITYTPPLAPALAASTPALSPLSISYPPPTPSSQSQTVATTTDLPAATTKFPNANPTPALIVRHSALVIPPAPSHQWHYLPENPIRPLQLLP